MTTQSKPILLVVDKLMEPVVRARTKLEHVRALKRPGLDEIMAHGLFVMGVSYTEIMLQDMLMYFWTKIPGKLSFDARTSTKSEMLDGDIVTSAARRAVLSLSHKPAKKMIESFFETLSIQQAPDVVMDELVEIEESRNLLLHNDLVVNEIYVSKAGPKRRSDKMESRLPVDIDYLRHATDAMLTLVRHVEGQTMTKYRHYTKLAALKFLWEYLFQSPVMRFEDYWDTEDSLGLVRYKRADRDESRLASSELMFLQVWLNHFNPHIRIKPEARLYMRSLDSIRREQMLYFLSVAHEVQFE